MPQDSVHIDPASLQVDIVAYRQGDPAAGDRLATVLRPVLLAAATQFLGRDHSDVEDVVNDATMATLRYLGEEVGFRGDLVRLAVTIARNRCRDLHRWRSTKPVTEITSMENWLASDASSPLDELLAAERVAMVQAALAALSADCRRLLHALYVAGRSTDEVRRELGLTTVQGVYYRRGVCLDAVKMFLQERFLGRSPGMPVGEAFRADKARNAREYDRDE